MVTNYQGLADMGCDGLTPLTPVAWYGGVLSGTGRYRPKQALYNFGTEGRRFESCRARQPSSASATGRANQGFQAGFAPFAFGRKSFGHLSRVSMLRLSILCLVSTFGPRNSEVPTHGVHRSTRVASDDAFLAGVVS